MDPSSSAAEAASSSSTAATTSPAAKAVEFARLIGKLKTTPRTGWVRRGVPRYESVADHSWRVATLSLLLFGRDDNIDASKCIQMALVHDLAECIVGDIAPDDNVAKADKEKMEHDAMEKIALTLGQSCPNNEARQRVLDLFQEYEKRETKEAKAVKDLDLLDMIIQADEYEQAFGLDLNEFFEGTPVSRFRDSTIEAVAKEVHEQRQQRIQTEPNESPPKDPFALSKADEAFVAEHAKASNLSAESVKETIKALRDWEKTKPI
jgi:putative hydrolase of HD superfamily